MLIVVYDFMHVEQRYGKHTQFKGIIDYLFDSFIW